MDKVLYWAFWIVAIAFISWAFTWMNRMAEEDYKACVEAGVHSDETCWAYVYQ